MEAKDYILEVHRLKPGLSWKPASAEDMAATCSHPNSGEI